MARPDLSRIEDVAREELDAKFAAREIGIAHSRKIIRNSANAIRAIHRDESEAAQELMDEAKALLVEISAQLGDHPDLKSGFVHDAAKEYAEARLTDALRQGDAPPDHRQLGVPVAAYLNGLGEAVGEMRRRLLDLLRAGRLDEAESVFQAMDDVLGLLAALDYPDGMTGGLRRTTDVARALIERSRADLTTTIVQERLRKELAGE